MERETDMLDFPFSLHLGYKTEPVYPLHGLIIILVESVKPVIIEIVYTAPFQLQVEYRLQVFGLADHPTGHFVCYRECIPWIAFCYGLTESIFALLVVIWVGCIEISTSAIFLNCSMSIDV